MNLNQGSELNTSSITLKIKQEPQPPLCEKSQKSKNIVENLSQSKLFQSYEQAFNDALGLPLTIRPIETKDVPLYQKKPENQFCSLMSSHHKTCSACLQTQHDISNPDKHHPQNVQCYAGLWESSVPITRGKEVLGFLQTGQVALDKHSERSFNRLSSLLEDWNPSIKPKQVRKAYFESKVIPSRQYHGSLHLLTTFSTHLSAMANQISIRETNLEPFSIKQAKDFIHQNQSDPLSLSMVAKSVNMSTHYFCKMFRKHTGLTFTDYLSRVRIEKSKNLLLNPNFRVSEIAYSVGFQSLTHFNRVFRVITGESPSQFRRKLPKTIE